MNPGNCIEIKNMETYRGIGKVTSTLTRVILAATGQSKWPLSISSIPLEVLLFPAYFPINYFEFSGYSRVHLTPMLIMADRRFSISTVNAPYLSDLLETRIESDGTLYSYATSTILMMFALLALDYDQQHPLIVERCHQPALCRSLTFFYRLQRMRHIP